MEKSIWDYSLLIWVIFIFIVIPLFGLVFLFYQRKRDEKTEHLLDLAEYVNDEFMTFQDEHENYSETKALRKFFSNSRVRLKALKLRSEHEQKKKNYEDEIDKYHIKNRVFAYDYEETIYEIFSKTANYFIPQYPKEKIVYHYSHIKKDEFVEELSSKLKLSKDEAESLFNVFLNKQSIFKDNFDNCGIGSTLELYWNVVSPNDFNFSRWIEAHPEIKSKAESKNLDEILKQVKERKRQSVPKR